MLVLLPRDTGSRRSIIFLSAGHAATTTTTIGRQWRRRRWTNGSEHGRRVRAYVESWGRQVNYRQSAERRIAPRIPDTLTVVRRRRRAGTGTLAARISGEGWKPRPASSSSLVLLLCSSSRFCSPSLSPVIDSCQPSALESFTRTKVDIAALAVLPLRPIPLDPSRPVLVFPSLELQLGDFFPFRLFVSFLLSDFSTNSSRPTLCCSLPLFSLNPFCHPLYMYTRIARFASIQLLLPPQRPLSFDIPLFRSLVLCSCFCYPVHCILSLPTSPLLPSTRPLLLGRYVTTRPRFLTVPRTPLSLPMFPHLLSQPLFLTLPIF